MFGVLSSWFMKKSFLLTRYVNKLQIACCGFAQSIPRMPAVFMNTVWHAGNQFCCASLALFVTYLRSGLAITCSLLSLELFSAEDNWSLNDGFAIWGDFAYYRRSQGNKHRFIIDEGHGKQNSCGGCSYDKCLSSKVVKDFDYEPGFQVGIVYMTRHSMLEAEYLFVQEWEGSCHKDDPGLLYFSASHPTYAQDFYKADKASAVYRSQFQNGEVNYFYYITPRRGDYFSGGWLAGIRYISLTENLEIEFHKGADKSPYRVHVWNHMPAIQAGGTIGWNPWRTLSWDFTAKVGVGFDCGRQHTYWGDVDNTVTLRDYEAKKFSLPLLVGGAVALTYQPWRFINLHVAYEFIYLNGILLAPDQMHKSPNPEHHVRAIGQSFIYGGTAGVTFTF